MKTHKYKNGDKIEKVTFLRYDEIEPQKARFMCFCGTEFTTRVYSIEKRHTRSCGCIRREVTSARGTISLNPKLITAVEADIRRNTMTIKAMSLKHGLNESRINTLRKKYYARV